ncbi:pyruvate formate-lyase activating enzyme [Plautia stali symbiont]|nr:pyruvate formate-lyase activating enzyme [Plautia stali symbiont]
MRRYDPVIDERLDATDLVMLDLKQINDDIHEILVGVSNHRTLDFARYLQKRGKRTWIRYVVVPGYSDDDDSVHRLGEFTKDMSNIEKIELLPYHELGKHKWIAMGEEYKLESVKPPTKETMERVKNILAGYGHNVMY